jgi:hypothetical protein
MLNFQSTMLLDLHLKDVPGIDEKTAQMMPDANVQTPVQLMGMFMLFQCDKKRMKAWLIEHCGMKENQATTVTDSLEAKAKRILSC